MGRYGGEWASIMGNENAGCVYAVLYSGGFFGVKIMWAYVTECGYGKRVC